MAGRAPDRAWFRPLGNRNGLSVLDGDVGGCAEVPVLLGNLVADEMVPCQMPLPGTRAAGAGVRVRLVRRYRGRGRYRAGTGVPESVASRGATGGCGSAVDVPGRRKGSFARSAAVQSTTNSE